MLGEKKDGKVPLTDKIKMLIDVIVLDPCTTCRLS